MAKQPAVSAEVIKELSRISKVLWAVQLITGEDDLDGEESSVASMLLEGAVNSLDDIISQYGGN